MVKSKKICKIDSVERLEYVRANVCNINEERIFSAVNSIRKREELCKLLRLFSELNNIFAEESDNLKEHEQTYNKEYATNVNGVFNECYMTLNCIKNQIFFLYRLMNMSSAKPNSREASRFTDTSTIEYSVCHSTIGTLPYTPYLFNELQTESQRRLVCEIRSFLSYLNSNINLCIKEIEEDQRIGNDEEECIFLMEKQVDEIYSYVKDNKNRKIDTDAEYYNDLLDVYNHPENAKKWWHKLNKKEMTNVSLGLKNARLAIYTPLERKVFKDDINLLCKFRATMTHLDEVVPKITGETLVFVMRYMGCDSTQSSFHKCFTETYKIVGGKHNVITVGRFNQAYSKIPMHNVPEFVDFQLKMDSFC